MERKEEVMSKKARIRLIYNLSMISNTTGDIENEIYVGTKVYFVRKEESIIQNPYLTSMNGDKY